MVNNNFYHLLIICKWLCLCWDSKVCLGRQWDGCPRLSLAVGLQEVKDKHTKLSCEHVHIILCAHYARLAIGHLTSLGLTAWLITTSEVTELSSWFHCFGCQWP